MVKEGNGLHKGGLHVGLLHDAGGRNLLFMGSIDLLDHSVGSLSLLFMTLQLEPIPPL